MVGKDKLTFTVTAGILVRKQLIHILRQMAWARSGISISNIEESRGWFESAYRVTIMGDAEQLIDFANEVMRLGEDNGR